MMFSVYMGSQLRSFKQLGSPHVHTNTSTVVMAVISVILSLTISVYVFMAMRRKVKSYRDVV